MKNMITAAALMLMVAAYSANAQKQRGLKLGEKIGKLAARVMTAKTSHLNQTAVTIQHINGMHTMDAHISGQEMYPEGFEEGDEAIAIFFTKVDGLGMLNIDGKIASGGKDLTATGLGFYMMELEKGDMNPKTITVETSTGDKASFAVKPIPSIRIVSVNGAGPDAPVDLSKDIQLVIENGAGHEGSLVRAAMVTDVAGARGFNYFAEFKSADKITIPKEALSNLNISGSVKGIANFNQGENYLMVERYVISPAEKQTTAVAEYQCHAYGSMRVNVTGKQAERTFATITARSKTETSNGLLNAEANKPNASTGAPFSQGSKFSVSSLSVRGVLFKEDVSQSTSYGYNSVTVTTVTTTYQFPQLPDVFWEQLLNSLHADIVAIFQQEFNIEVVPTEKITSSPHYQNFYTVKEANTDELISKTYKNTLSLQPSKLGDIIGAVNTNMTSDKPIINLMKDGGVDGLINVQLSLQVAGNDKGNIVLVPHLSYSIVGREEKYTNKEITYGNGWVAASEGIPFSSSDFNDINALNRIVRKTDMMKGFRESLQALRAKEREMGYDKIWGLK